ncbi:hypothetical protein BXY39_2003 [Eilatimonas milleporae]|uniref:Uncharacterized protein n=2 Tax=Eilatimonas milleporae TaxID=911205 RepID=A0A3M0CLF5_9PROT|nr:hypothetical protein BXY39_2003 [Eilatimonas milleporae]
MQLAFTVCDGRLLCALKVCDDGEDGSILWSVVEHEEELNGIRSLARREPLVAFLFNELAVNVSWNDLYTIGALDRLSTMADSAALGQVNHSAIKVKVSPLLDRFHRHVQDDGGWWVLEMGGRSDWKTVHNHFITSGASSGLIDLFDSDEGKHQEQLGVWLTGNLQPLGVQHSPQVSKGTGTRELTNEFGSVLIESKTLSVLARKQLPERAKLKRNLSAHISKAFAQLRGAIRALKSGAPVTSTKGNKLLVEREYSVHAIVLIPDLELVNDRSAYGIKFIQDFMSATGGFAHLLDVAELLRSVQAAEIIAMRGKTATPR